MDAEARVDGSRPRRAESLLGAVSFVVTRLTGGESWESSVPEALVRLGESFLYADVLAARKPDVATANRLQQAIIEGILP